MKLSVENTARLAFAAVVVLGAMIVAVWYRQDALRYAPYQLRTHDAVSGLIADAPVELHGVEVGSVQRVSLVDPRTVDVLLRIRKDVPVTMGTVATVTARGLATRGFTGYVVVSLEDAGTDPRRLSASANEPVPTIRSAPSRSVSLDTTISQVNETVQVLSELLRSVLDARTIASLKHSVDNLESITRTLASNNDRLTKIIANTERASGMVDAHAIDSLRRSVDNLQGITGTLASNSDRLATIIMNTESASTQLKPLLQSTHEVVGSLQMQLLPDAYSTLANLQQLSSSLNRTAARIDRDPSLVLRGQARPPPGPGEAQ